MYSAPTASEVSEFHAYILGIGSEVCSAVTSAMYRMVATYIYRLRRGADNVAYSKYLGFHLISWECGDEQQHPAGHFPEREHHTPVETDQFSLLVCEESFITRLVPRSFS
jgi:hypothetical protein